MSFAAAVVVFVLVNEPTWVKQVVFKLLRNLKKFESRKSKVAENEFEKRVKQRRKQKALSKDQSARMFDGVDVNM